MRTLTAIVSAALGTAWLVACGDIATLTVADGTGPAPRLPAPSTSVIPTMKIAPAVGWSPGAHPVAADGLDVAVFADKLEHPRWLYVLPNGDVLVAETNAPPKPEDGKGVTRLGHEANADEAAGAAAERQSDHAAARERRRRRAPTRARVFLDGLHSPFGMALVGSDFYVADTDALLRFPYRAGRHDIAAPRR